MTETGAPYIVAVRPAPTLIIPDLREYSLEEYINLLALDDDDGEQFKAYLPDFTLGKRYTLNCWDMWWDRFVQAQDATDERKTQRAALGELCDRFVDWDDERHDPHLDAFV